VVIIAPDAARGEHRRLATKLPRTTAADARGTLKYPFEKMIM